MCLNQVRLSDLNFVVFNLDGGPRPVASSWRLLQRPVEHSGLHSGQWGAGGFCIFVSMTTPYFLCFKVS